MTKIDVSNIAVDLYRDHQFKVEEWLRLRIKPKPKGWPKWFYNYCLRNLIVLGRSGIKLEVPDEKV